MRFGLNFASLTEGSRSGLQCADGYEILKDCKILTRILICAIQVCLFFTFSEPLIFKLHKLDYLLDKITIGIAPIVGYIVRIKQIVGRHL